MAILGDIVGAHEADLLRFAQAQDFRSGIRREPSELKRERPSVWMLRVCGVPANQMVESHLLNGNPRRAQAAFLERRLHCWIGGRLVEVGVFAFDVQKNDAHVGCLRLLHEPGDGGRFAAAGGAENGGMTWQDGFLFRGNAHGDALVSDDQTEA